MSMTFEEHKEATAADCEAAAELLTKLAAEVRSGDMRAFEAFWIEGGTEEGDAKVNFIREMMALRFYRREEALRSNVQAQPTGAERVEKNDAGCPGSAGAGC